jgi:hypothetical protein
MKSRIVSTIFLVLAFTCLANSQASDRSYNLQIQKFFAFVQANKYGEAIDYIYSGNKWMKAKPDEIANVRTSFNGLTALVGEFRGYENITEESIGTRYVVAEYMALFDRQPFRFYFRFYKPEDSWVIDAFGYQGDLDEWLQQKSKDSYLYHK